MTYKTLSAIERNLNELQIHTSNMICAVSHGTTAAEPTPIQDFILNDARILVNSLKIALQKISELEYQLLCSPQKSRAKKP